MATLFANDTLDIACPACNHLAKLGVDWLRKNRRYSCENCASELEIDSEQLLERLNDVDRAVEDLRTSVRRLKEML